MSRVAYSIMCHGSAAFMRELYQLIYAPEVQFFFHADEKSPPELKLLLAKIAMTNPNAVVLPSRLCSWAGFSLLEVMLDMTVAATQREGWDHLIFLSEQHLPLCGRAAIASALAPDCNYIETNMYHKMWEGGRADVAYRAAQLYFEVPGVGAFGTITVGHSEAFYDQLHHGSQWMVLCRKTCAVIAAHRHASFWESFRHTVLADEIAIQTFVAGQKTPGVSNISKTLSFVAHPGNGGNREMTFNEELYFSAQSRGFLFIRKRPVGLSGRIVAFLESAFPPMSRPVLPDKKGQAVPLANLPLAAQTIMRAVNEHLPESAGKLAPMPAYPSMPSFFCKVQHQRLAWPFAVYAVSQDLYHFKVLAVVHDFPKSFGMFTLGGYRVGMIRARLLEIAFHGEIHLAVDHDHGFITVETENDLPKLAALIGIFVERTLCVPAPEA